VDDTLGQNYIMYVQYDYPNVPIDLTIRNSIFRGVGPGSPVFMSGATNLVLDHNLFCLPESDEVLDWAEDVYTANDIVLLGTGNVYGDPLFVSPAWGTEGDYHLQEGSPAIDAGTSEGAPTDDLEGRPRGDQPDLGAYER
jgi:hypothetical protein